MLTADFVDAQRGWLVRSDSEATMLSLYRTADGGRNWENKLLPLIPSPLDGASPVAAWLEFRDELHGWLAIKLQSSINFSLGRLFITEDGGLSWQERSLPLGEPARFLDSQRGWVAGGPAGDELYRTDDGGATWQPQFLPLPVAETGERTFVGLPEFSRGHVGYLPVTRSGPGGVKLLIYITRNGGNSWELAEALTDQTETEISQSLPFSLGRDGAWRVGIPSMSDALSNELRRIVQKGYELGVQLNSMDFITSQIGWAAVQAGTCQGAKTSQRCEQFSRLMATSDGGLTWKNITPPR